MIHVDVRAIEVDNPIVVVIMEVRVGCIPMIVVHVEMSVAVVVVTGEVAVRHAVGVI